MSESESERVCTNLSIDGKAQIEAFFHPLDATVAGLTEDGMHIGRPAGTTHIRPLFSLHRLLLLHLLLAQWLQFLAGYQDLPHVELVADPQDLHHVLLPQLHKERSVHLGGQEQDGWSEAGKQ